MNARGFEVVAFNLGGLFDTFFTRGITDAAEFVDKKIKQHMDRYHCGKVHVVAHSKGGLVALWWLLALGGHKYCNKVITMGTPFNGSRLAFLALMTPFGFVLPDVWQMRPGSGFLRKLRKMSIPQNVEIYCLYSEQDGVSRPSTAVLAGNQNQENIIPVPMNQVGHFGFLCRRDVGDVIAKILNEEKSGKNSQVG